MKRRIFATLLTGMATKDRIPWNATNTRNANLLDLRFDRATAVTEPAETSLNGQPTSFLREVVSRADRVDRARRTQSARTHPCGRRPLLRRRLEERFGGVSP